MNVREAIVGLSAWINRNTGWLIATAIVFFGLTTFHALKTNEQIARDTKSSVETSSQLLLNQQAILTAIEKLAKDSKLSQEEKLDITICMLQVEISERTTDLLNGCRERAANGDPVTEPAPQPPETGDESPKE